MLNFSDGVPIAKIESGKYNGKLIYIDPKEDTDEEQSFHDDKCKLHPRLDVFERSVSYISGPSGSGKTRYAADLIKAYTKFYPKKDFYLFSRTNYKEDPAFEDLKPIQIMINESLIETPIDITRELTGGTIVLFDDCNTIQDDKLKKIIDKLMADIMEVGRKLDITIIITNHLIIPNDKKIARTIMNELQSLTVFPKSGSAQQIRYVLKTYFGLSAQQINDMLQIHTRWLTISKKYPMYVIYERGCYIL